MIEGAFSQYERNIVAAVEAEQQQKIWNVYYSRGRFTTSVSTTPFVYTVALGTNCTFFGYSIAQTMGAVNLSSVTATPADTSLQQQSQTINGENCLIRGIGVMLLDTSDPAVAKQLIPSVSWKARLSGQDYRLGIATMLPGGGGLLGLSESMSAFPNPFEQYSMRIGGLANGVPQAGGYYPLRNPLVWRNTSKGASTFNVIANAEFAVSTLANMAGADRVAEPQTTTFSGTNAWTHPTAANTFVDFMVVLDTVPYYVN
jgi:hypothetical protein